jgi:hypothetical protein
MGRDRLKKEEREVLNALLAGKSEGERMTYDETVDWSRKMIPIMLAGWDFDGSPMTYKDQPFPPTAENIGHLPDALVVSIASAATDLWSKTNPTDGDSSQTGSEQTEQSSAELSQIETTVP